MKLRTFLAMALIALCTVSCSDDDELNELDKQTQVVEQVAGSYPGVITKAVKSSSQGSFDATIQIKAQKDGKVTIEFPGEESTSPMSMKAFTLTDVEVKSVSASEFTFRHDAFTVNVGIDYVSTGLTGSLKNGILTFAYDIKPGEMPMAISLNYTNDKEDMFAAKVVGSYKGANFLSVMKKASAAVQGTIEIKAQEGGHFTIVTPAVALGGPMNLPAFTISDVVIKSTGADEYSIEHEKFTLDEKYLFVDGLKGSLKKGALTLEYSIQPGEMPMPIALSFTQNKELVKLAALSKKYEGSVKMSVGTMTMDPLDAAYNLIAQPNGKMTLKFPKLAMDKMILESFSLEDVDINIVNDNEFTIEHAAFTTEVGEKEMKLVNKNGVKGTFKENQLTLDYDITPGAMQAAINFHFGKKEVIEGSAAKIAGSYKGKVVAMKDETVEATYTIQAQKDGKATIIIPKLATSMPMPGITIKDVVVEAVSETEFNLKCDAFEMELESGKKVSSKNGVKGSVKDGILTLEYDLKIGAMPMSIDFKFVSEK